MSTKNKISRREALKRIGAAVFGSTIASSGLLSLTSRNMKKQNESSFISQEQATVFMWHDN